MNSHIHLKYLLAYIRLKDRKIPPPTHEPLWWYWCSDKVKITINNGKAYSEYNTYSEAIGLKAPDGDYYEESRWKGW